MRVQGIIWLTIGNHNEEDEYGEYPIEIYDESDKCHDNIHEGWNNVEQKSL